MAGFDDFPIVAPASNSFDDFPVVAAPQPGVMAGVSRALENNIPFVDRAVAGAQSILPQGYGGTGQDYAANLATERAKNAQFASDNPWTSAVGGITAAAPLVAFGGPGGIAGGALTGAGIGAVEGASQAPDLTDWSQGGVAKNALSSALLGAGIGAGGGVVGAGLGKLMPAAVDAEAPTLDTIGPMKTAAYQAADQLGAAYKPQAYADMPKGILDDAQSNSISAARHPKAYSAITDLTSSANDALDNDTPVTLRQLDSQRQVINRDVMSSPDPAERYFGRKAISGIDNLISTAGPDQMAAGSEPEAADAIRTARDLAQRQFKLNELQENLAHAKLMAAKSGVGGNADNWTRTALQRALEGGSNWTPEETAQLTQGVMGTTGQNMLRGAGRLSPFGNSLTGLTELGLGGLAHAAGGLPVMPAAAAVGIPAKAAADAMSRANAKNVVNTILRGGTAAPPPSPVNVSPLANALAAYSSAGR